MQKFRQVMQRNPYKMAALVTLAIALVIAYMTIDVNMKFFAYVMEIRIPKMMSILIASFCIGYASIIFQSVINNRIVTPCLLGMNSLYVLTHTGLALLLGTTSVIFTNGNLSFIVDLFIMGVAATIIYGYLFRKTKYNVLYVLLAGTVIATLFTSLSNTMMRVMDPNEFQTLQDSLIAGFSNVNSEIIVLSISLIVALGFLFRKQLRVLDVLTLGKQQSINLGVDYDRSISRLLLGVTILIAIATALVGPISFLGLIIANISREYFKTFRHSYLMMGSFLMGVIILSFGQILIEHVFSYTAVISVFINVLGGVYFLYLILSNKGA